MDDTGNTDLKGLGGWLVLVGINVVLSPVLLVAECFLLYSPIFSDGVWEELTTAGTNSYHPMWPPFIIGEMFLNSVILLVSIYLIYMFFSKHYRFPNIFVLLLLFSFVVVIVDAWVATIVFPDDPMFDSETSKELFQSIIGMAIWIPYMRVSKRVAATFVEKIPAERLRTDADLFA